MALYPETILVVSISRSTERSADRPQFGTNSIVTTTCDGIRPECRYIRKKREDWIAGLPTMEDANSVQVGLAEVMRLLVTKEVDLKTGALLLYAMQTGSANLKRTCFEPRAEASGDR